MTDKQRHPDKALQLLRCSRHAQLVKLTEAHGVVIGGTLIMLICPWCPPIVIGWPLQREMVVTHGILVISRAWPKQILLIFRAAR
ncbi:hypothetical protein DL546_009656 [Coniochaeta pulveracea]|uniref:Uncharacterized protein n=1 Tax=Coniochaeta pulveracea TaxID=177199 RepID=A0A420YLH1_9PEZI|nr:hypothetical protein DL546_009656 [Coniochaeta pulveracea]